MPEPIHQPRVDAVIDGPQSAAMRPVDSGQDDRPDPIPADDAEVDGEERALRQDIAETPPAG